MEIIDSHCHIHDEKFFTPKQRMLVYERARDNRVGMVCVGTDVADSRAAVDFATNHEGVWAVVGVHPHEAKHGVAGIGEILAKKPLKVVGVGEIGLDYHYSHSPRQAQIKALEQQLQWAMEYGLSVNFHVREAYGDFWPILDNFKDIRGVLHSFTDSQTNVDKAFERELFIGVNGISTFTKDRKQQEMFGNLPLSKILLETDAPFLTPAPLRGKVNEPSLVGKVAEHLAAQRHVSALDVATITTNNAIRLYQIN